jgi:alkyl hydroperoxide reductase subunit AhpC
MYYNSSSYLYMESYHYIKSYHHNANIYYFHREIIKVYIKTSKLRNKDVNIMVVGNMAPTFTANALVNGQMQKVSLDNYKEKWVILFFYPGDFSFVCPTEIASLAKRYNEFKGLNAEILAISSDSVYTHKMLNQIEISNMVNGGVPFPMLSDETGSIGKSYGVYSDKLGASLRATFIIDADGYVQGMETLNPNIGRSTTEILRQLQAFQTYASTNQLVPCDWNPGDKTIVELIEAVGNIWTQWKP